MIPEQSLETWLALMIMNLVAAEYFRRLTGMTLDEWDELNYQRIMGYDGSA